MPIGSITMKDLLEAGVHFGHQTKRWNPKMSRYIYGERNDIYILDLQKSMRQLKRSYKFFRDVTRQGGKVLLVSTKKQAQEIIESEAERAGMYFVNQRWLGGMLTNFQTISLRVKHLKTLEKQEADGMFDLMTKKEEARTRKQLNRLRKYLTGVKDMSNLPDAIFIIDPRRENIALLEARRLKIPIVAIVDTNCDPENIDFPIPGNDDAIRAIKIVTNYLVDAMAEGMGARNKMLAARAKEQDAKSAASKPKRAVVKKQPKDKVVEAKASEAPKVVASASPDEAKVEAKAKAEAKAKPKPKVKVEAKTPEA